MKTINVGITISDAAIINAMKILIDNGIPEDEADVVLQALGYALFDAELEPPYYPDILNKDGRKYVCLDDYIATKLWSEEDVRGCVLERYPEYSDEQVEEVVSDVIHSGYLDTLEDCTNDDWYIIDYAIDEIHKRKMENENSNSK